MVLPTGPLAGLAISAPAEAWGAPVTVTLVTTPVTAVSLEGVRAGSALVSLEVDGARFAGAPVHVFLPGDVGTADEVAMVFGYDRATGEFEAMPSYPSPGGTSFVTQHFSEYLTLLTQRVRLDVALPTPFQYGVDDFPLVNEGSWLAPGGFCSGQVVAAITYFLERRLDGGAPLVSYADQRPPDAGPSTRASQAFYADDQRAWLLTSTVQSESVFSFVNWDKWKDVQQAAHPPLANQLLSAALYVTRRPQLLDIRRFQPDGGSVGHALLVFGKSVDDAGVRYLVSDPNWPYREDAGVTRTVHYLGGDAGFEPYTGRLNATDPTRNYTQFTFLGTWAFVSRDAVRTMWESADADRLGDGFPDVSLVARATPGPGNPEAPLRDGLVRTDPMLLIAVDPAPFTWRLTVYAPDYVRRATATSVLDDWAWVSLAPGDNLLGVLVEGRSGHQVPDYRWVDFRWVTVRYQAPVPQQPRVLGSLALPSPARGLDVRDGTAWVMLDAQGLAVVDVSQDAAPALLSVSNIGVHSTGRGVVVSAERYGFAGVGSFKILDLAEPLSPSVVSAVGFNADCGRLVVREPWAFIACGAKSYVSEGLLGIATVADAGTPSTNRGVAGITWSRTVRDVELSDDGTTAFLLGSGGAVAAFDVHAPATPGTVPLSTLTAQSTTAHAMTRGGGTLYVAAESLSVADVSTPTAMRWLARDPYRDVRDVAVSGTTLVAVGVLGSAGRLWIYDVSNPAAPTVTWSLELPAPATAVKVVGRKAYVTTWSSTTSGALLVVGL